MQIEAPKLWFDSASSVLHLPRMLSISIIGVVPATVLWYIGINIRIATDFTGFPPVSLPLLMANVVFLLFASQLIRARTLQLEDYTESLGVELEPNQLGRLTSLKGILVVWALLLGATSFAIDPYVYNLYYPPLQAAMRLVVTGYLRFIQATFLWTLGCSMYLIYKWGKLPIRLRSFAEDRTLGLNSYGRASLLFVSVYIVAMLLTFPVFVYQSEAVMWSQLMFSCLGLVLFLVPLFSLRSKLVQAKSEKLAWITRRHRRAIESIESCGDGPIDTALVNELIAVDNIRTDLQRISGWPFNAGVVIRVVTVVFLPITLLILSTILVRALNL